MSHLVAHQRIGPHDGPSFGIEAKDGAVIDSIAYHKKDEADAITRIELASVDFHKLTGLDDAEYSFLVKGKKADGSALSTSLSGSPVSAPAAPAVNSCVGLEQSLSANITVEEAGDLLFFLIDAAGAILEISKPSSDAGTYEIQLSDGLVEGGSYEVSVMLKVARGFSSVSNTQNITLSNIPDGIAITSQSSYEVDGQVIHQTLAVAQPDDHAADFKLEAEVTTAKEWTEEELVAQYQAGDSAITRIGTGSTFTNKIINVGVGTDIFGADFNPIHKMVYAYKSGRNPETMKTIYWVEKIGQVKSVNVTYKEVTLMEPYAGSLGVGSLIFLTDAMELTTEVKQVSPDAVDQKYLIGASLIIGSLGDFASVKLRWTNDEGSSAYSSAFLMHYSKTDPLEHARNNLKVTPSIADKVLSFAVSAREESEEGLKSSSYLFGGVSKTHLVNEKDGRIVKSMPADQDLSAISASQDISSSLEYETGFPSHFYGRLNIPRIEAGAVAIQAKEVHSDDGGKVEFDFTDESDYHDGASRTSVTINETDISQQAPIPANTSGSTEFQLKGVKYNLPPASIAATDSMEALSGIADWQSLPLRSAEVFGNTVLLGDGPTAVGDFFIHFDFSIKADVHTFSWVELTDTEKDELIAQLNAAYGAKDWYTMLTERHQLSDVPLKYEDGDKYFVEKTGSSWKMFYKSGDMEPRTNISGNVADGKLVISTNLFGTVHWNTTTLYNGSPAPVAFAGDLESFDASRFILDRAVQTHTAVSPPSLPEIAISAEGLTGEVRATVTPGDDSGNQTLYHTRVRYYDENETIYDKTSSPYSVEPGPGVKVTARAFLSYSYIKADGTTTAHVVESLVTSEANGMTEPIISNVAKSADGKQLTITYQSGGKTNDLSLFVFGMDSNVSPNDRYLGTVSGKGSFHQVKQITNLPLTGSRDEVISFSHFSDPISKYMIVLTRIPANGDGDSSSAVKSEM